MKPAGRIVAITVLLAALGGFAGAFGGALIALGYLLATSGLPSFSLLMAILRTAGAVGFGVGVLAGPVLAWTMLRQAPIWRAVGETALGAGLVAAVFIVVDTGFIPMLGASVLGATLAAVRLRRATKRAARPAHPMDTRSLEG
jgi:hypothetical protein